MADQIISLPVQPTAAAACANLIGTPIIQDTSGMNGQVCQVNWPVPTNINIATCCNDGEEVRVQEECVHYCRTDRNLADWRSCIGSALGTVNIQSANPSCFDTNEGIIGPDPGSQTTLTNLEIFPSITNDLPGEASTIVTNLVPMPSFAGDATPTTLVPTDGPGGQLSSAIESALTGATTAGTGVGAGQTSGATSAAPTSSAGSKVVVSTGVLGSVGVAVGAVVLGAVYMLA